MTFKWTLGREILEVWLSYTLKIYNVNDNLLLFYNSITLQIGFLTYVRPTCNLYIILGVLFLNLIWLYTCNCFSFLYLISSGQNLIWMKYIWKHVLHRRLLISWSYWYFYLLKICSLGYTMLMNFLPQGIIFINVPLSCSSHKCPILLTPIKQLGDIRNILSRRGNKNAPQMKGGSLGCLNFLTTSLPLTVLRAPFVYPSAHSRDLIFGILRHESPHPCMWKTFKTLYSKRETPTSRKIFN